MAGSHGWRGIQGSAALRTGRIAAAPAIARAEALAPGEMRRVPVGGDLLGAARVRGRFAALPLEAFDRAGALPPEEQGAYFQLLRLSYGEGRNFCRASKHDLMARLGASERRLLRILDGLVARGLLRLLHRDNRGTLYRVFLPREAAREAAGDDVHLGAPDASLDTRSGAHELPPANAPPADGRTAAGDGRTAGAAIPPPIPLRRAAASRGPRAAHESRAAAPPSSDGLGALAAALAAARGTSGPDALAAAADEVRDLLADGATPRQVEAAVRALARRAARPAPLAPDEGGSP